MRRFSAHRMEPAAGSISPVSILSNVVFPLPFDPPGRAGVGPRVRFKFSNSIRPQRARDFLGNDQSLCLAVGCGEIDTRRGRCIARRDGGQFLHQPSGLVNPRAGFAGARLWPAPQPLDFAIHLLASASSSLRCAARNCSRRERIRCSCPAPGRHPPGRPGSTRPGAWTRSPENSGRG